jgi:hypothetical protein
METQYPPTPPNVVNGLLTTRHQGFRKQDMP